MKNAGGSTDSNHHPLFPTCGMAASNNNNNIRGSASPSFGSDLSLSEMAAASGNVTPAKGSASQVGRETKDRIYELATCRTLKTKENLLANSFES